MVDCGPECQEALRELERFLDRELDDVVRMKVERHLSGCGDCTDRMEFQVRLKVMIQTKCSERELPAGLEARVRRVLSTFEAGPEPR